MTEESSFLEDLVISIPIKMAEFIETNKRVQEGPYKCANVYSMFFAKSNVFKIINVREGLSTL